MVIWPPSWGRLPPHQGDDASNIHGIYLRVVQLDRAQRRVWVQCVHRQQFGFTFAKEQHTKHKTQSTRVEFVNASTLATHVIMKIGTKMKLKIKSAVDVDHMIDDCDFFDVDFVSLSARAPHGGA